MPDGFIEIKIDGTKICDAYNVAPGYAQYSIIQHEDNAGIVTIANGGNYTFIYSEESNIDLLRKVINNIVEEK